MCCAPDNDASHLPQSTCIDSVQVWELHPDNITGPPPSNDAGAFAQQLAYSSGTVSQDDLIGAPVEIQQFLWELGPVSVSF